MPQVFPGATKGTRTPSLTLAGSLFRRIVNNAPYDSYGTSARKSFAKQEKTRSQSRRFFLVQPKGLEPLAFGSVDRRSIQLSYGCKIRLFAVKC